MSQPTIKHFLFSVDPSIEVIRTSDSKYHTHVKDPRWPQTIKKWEEFNLKTLRNMSGGILTQALNSPFDYQKCPKHGAHIRETFDRGAAGARSLEMILSSTIQRTVNCALLRTPQKQPGIVMDYGERAAPFTSGVTGHEYKPDWAGCRSVRPSKDHNEVQPPKYRTKLPGNTKLSWKVDFNLLDQKLMTEPNGEIDFIGLGIKNGDKTPDKPAEDLEYHKESHGLRQAIIQIYTYCCHAGCRYGYILTEKELVVVRVRPRNGADQKDLPSALKNEGFLEYRLINYNVGNGRELSVNLALWWLHLLAAVDHKTDWKYPQLINMTMNLKPAGAQDRARAQPERSARPTDSQIDKEKSFRPPAPKRKQESMHNNGRRENPIRPGTTSKLLTDGDIQLEPESVSDFEMIHSSRRITQGSSGRDLMPKPVMRRHDQQSDKDLAKSTTPQVLFNSSDKTIRPARPPPQLLNGRKHHANISQDNQEPRAPSKELPGSRTPVPANQAKSRSQQTPRTDFDPRVAGRIDRAQQQQQRKVPISKDNQERRTPTQEPLRSRTPMPTSQAKPLSQQTSRPNSDSRAAERIDRAQQQRQRSPMPPPKRVNSSFLGRLVNEIDSQSR